MFVLPDNPYVFQPQVALHLGLGSSLAYKEPEIAIESLQHRGFQVHCMESTELLIDAQCFLAIGDRYQVLSFRGTEGDSIADWLQNLDVRKIGWIKGKVHCGFEDEWESLRKRIQEKLCPRRPLLITGHSKGAAEATLAATELFLTGFNVAGLYTFGSPRVLDWEAAEYFNSLALAEKAYRCFHSNDLVPRVPIAFRFKHVGRPIYLREYRESWKSKKIKTWIENPSFWQLAHYQWTSYFFDGIEDHDIINYIRCLRHSG